MFWFIVLVIVVVLVVAVAMRMRDQKVAAHKLTTYPSLRGAKIFKQIIQTPIAITEEGNIGITNPSTQQTKIFNIKDVNGFEIVVDGKNVANISGAIAGSLLFGGVGAIIGGTVKKEQINSITLLFKLNDFNNPTMSVPLLTFGMKKGSSLDQQLQREITELVSTLEYVEKKIKG